MHTIIQGCSHDLHASPEKIELKYQGIWGTQTATITDELKCAVIVCLDLLWISFLPLSYEFGIFCGQAFSDLSNYVLYPA